LGTGGLRVIKIELCYDCRARKNVNVDVSLTKVIFIFGLVLVLLQKKTTFQVMKKKREYKLPMEIRNAGKQCSRKKNIFHFRKENRVQILRKR
jgi:hypothetical protein